MATPGAESGLGTRAAAATRSNLLTLPLIAALSFGASVVIVRILPIDEFAIYALVLGLRSTVQFLADLGTGSASARAFAQLEAGGGRTAARRLYAQLVLARAAVATVLIAVALASPDGVADVLSLRPEEQGLVAPLAVLMAAEIAAGLGVYVLIGTLRQRWLNTVILVQNVAMPMLVVLAAVAGGGLAAIVSAMAAVSVLRCALLHVGAARSLNAIVPAPGAPERASLRSFSHTSAAASVGKLAAWLHSRPALSLVMIAAVARPEFALFALAYDFTHQVMALAAAPGTGVVQAVMAKTANDDARLRRALAAATAVLALVACSIASVFLATIPVLDSLAFGLPFADLGRFAAFLVPMLVLEVALAFPAASLLLADDRTLRPYVLVRAAELALVGLYFVVGTDDPLAVTIVMALVRGAVALVLFALVQHRFGRLLTADWWARLFGVCALATGSGLVVTELLPAAAVVRVFTGGALAASVFVVSLRFSALVAAPVLGFARRTVPAAGPLLDWLAGPRATVQ